MNIFLPIQNGSLFFYILLGINFEGKYTTTNIFLLTYPMLGPVLAGRHFANQGKQ